MTALEEILQTEQTAEKEIANAKEVAAAPERILAKLP